MAILLAFMIMVITVAFTIAAYYSYEGVLFFIAAIHWFIYGGYMYTLSVGMWDVYYAMFFVAMFVGVVMSFEAGLVYRERRKKAKLDIDTDKLRIQGEVSEDDEEDELMRKLRITVRRRTDKRGKRREADERVAHARNRTRRELKRGD